MSEQDALSKFDFSKVTKSGVFLQFEPGKPVTVRILTTNPVVYSTSFEDKSTGETVVATKFAFIVYNFSDNMAQVLKATPHMAKKIGEIHKDPDFGSNIKEIDLKITPPNKGEIKAYDVQVLPNARTLTKDQVDECRKIELDKLFEEQLGSRMSVYEPEEYKKPDVTVKTGNIDDDGNLDIDTDEPINLDDIPF